MPWLLVPQWKARLLREHVEGLDEVSRGRLIARAEQGDDLVEPFADDEIAHEGRMLAVDAALPAQCPGLALRKRQGLVVGGCLAFEGGETVVHASGKIDAEFRQRGVDREGRIVAGLVVGRTLG